METEKIEKKILKIAIDLAREGNGALFVIGDDIKYKNLLRQKLEPFSVFERGSEKVLKGLANIDGAVVIGSDGIVKDYGVMLKSPKAFIGYGTRHAAALSASRKGNTSILCSEEERKVKIFKDGRYIMQIDALQKNVEKSVPQITTLLESLGAGLLGTIGVASLTSNFGIALIPGVLVFGGSYYAIKKIFNRWEGK